MVLANPSRSPPPNPHQKNCPQGKKGIWERGRKFGADFRTTVFWASDPPPPPRGSQAQNSPPPFCEGGCGECDVLWLVLFFWFGLILESSHITHPVQDRRSEFPTQNAHTHAHTFMVLTAGLGALRTAVSRVPALSHKHWQPPQVPQCVAVSETHGQWCTVRHMTHEIRAEPPDHRTGSAGLETDEECQRTSHSP